MLNRYFRLWWRNRGIGSAAIDGTCTAIHPPAAPHHKPPQPTNAVSNGSNLRLILLDKHGAAALIVEMQKKNLVEPGVEPGTSCV